VSVDLASLEHRDSSLHPYLEVSYTVLPEPTPTPTPLPEIVVEKTGPEEPLFIGEYGNISYNIEVTNPGMQAVSDVVVTDTLPVGTEFLSSSDSGVYDSESNSVVWTIESLMAGESQSFTVNVGVPTWVVGAGSLTNLVTGVCKECAEKGQGLWEVPVMRATPTPTPPPIKVYLVTVYQRGQ
jgi:uncharacterized repeat protein (TIGR01451 family)